MIPVVASLSVYSIRIRWPEMRALDHDNVSVDVLKMYRLKPEI